MKINSQDRPKDKYESPGIKAAKLCISAGGYIKKGDATCDISPLLSSLISHCYLLRMKCLSFITRFLPTEPAGIMPDLFSDYLIVIQRSCPDT